MQPGVPDQPVGRLQVCTWDVALGNYSGSLVWRFSLPFKQCFILVELFCDVGVPN